MEGQANGPTNGWTDRPMDKGSYRDTQPRLKTQFIVLTRLNFSIMLSLLGPRRKVVHRTPNHKW